MVQQLQIDGETWCCVRDYAGACGIINTRNWTSNLDTIQHRAKNARGYNIMSAFARKSDLERMKTRRNVKIKNGPGTVYAFLAQANYTGDEDYWLKVGATSGYEQRIKQYYGPSKVERMLCVFETDNKYAAETKVIEALQPYFSAVSKEWFRIPKSELDTLISILYEIKDATSVGVFD